MDTLGGEPDSLVYGGGSSEDELIGGEKGAANRNKDKKGKEGISSTLMCTSNHEWFI